MSNNWRKWRDLAYLCCPWCDFKVKTRDEITRHCLDEHYDLVIEECDSIVFTIESKAFQGEILPKTADVARKRQNDWQWAMSDDLNTFEAVLGEESTQLLWEEESKVHIIFEFDCDSTLESLTVHTISLKNDFYNPHCRLKFFLLYSIKTEKNFRRQCAL